MKNILVLGGTRLFGRKLVDLLIKEGHNVTIVTRGKHGNPFGDQVEHIIVDRTNKTEFTKIMENRTFDIVFDNICYSPNDAYTLCEIFNGKIEKLIFTSTLSTYEIDGKEKSEVDFDPYTYEIKMGDIKDFSYGEGKRQAEAVFFKYAKFPVVAVRFPIVMDRYDYTKRLHFHVERVLNEEPIGFVNLNAEMSFIDADEAAEFLKWAAESDIEGPYNATANGKISLESLMKCIEKVTGKSAEIVLDSKEEDLSPYAVPQSWYMSNEKAKKSGFVFSNLEDWLEPLIIKIVEDMRNN